MRKNPKILWITAIALGWCFDLLFWKQTPGINFTIFAILCLVGGLLLLRLDNQKIARRALWLFPSVLFFASVPFIRAEPFTVFLGFVFTLLSMGILAITALGGCWFSYGAVDFARGFLKLTGSVIARAWMFYLEVRRMTPKNSPEKAPGQVPEKAPGQTLVEPSGQAVGVGQEARDPKLNLWPVVRGIMIALPILAIFGALLASADVIFGHELDTFMKLFKLDNLPEYIFRLVYIVGIAYALSGVYLHAATQSKDEKLTGEGELFIPKMFGFTEAAIVLGSVVVLFGAFVIVQFRYFFGGQTNIQLSGFTYSEYARHGFGELIAVACFSLLLIMGLGAITRRDGEARRRFFSGLSLAIVILVMVILVSAYQRLTLYEIAYGFSRLRTYTHVFLIWIGLLLTAVVVLEIFRREGAFTIAILLASLGFSASLSILNVDGIIVRPNVLRATQGEGLDVPYLASLSSDSIPILAEIFQSEAMPGLTRDAVGAVLFCRLQSNPVPSIRGWQSFTLSGWQADQEMGRIQNKLTKYQIVNDQQDILTPGSVLYHCD